MVTFNALLAEVESSSLMTNTISIYSMWLLLYFDIYIYIHINICQFPRQSILIESNGEIKTFMWPHIWNILENVP